MADPDQQAATQLANIEKSTGRALAGFTALIKASGLEKHGQIVAMLKAEHGLGHGNANLIAKLARDKLDGGPAAADDLLEAQYSGAKQALRPIFDRVARLARSMGPDAKEVVQKTAVAFRRKKNFLVVTAPSAKRVELGLNLEATPAGERVVPARGMCTHKLTVAAVEELDGDVEGWIRAAYELAG